MRFIHLLLAISVAAGLVIWLLVPSDNANRTLLDRLEKKDRNAQFESHSRRPVDSTSTQLTADVHARHDDLTGQWRLGKVGLSDQVVLPYSPFENTPRTQEPTNGGTVLGNPFGFVGPQACKECHPKNFAGFTETSHALTSRPVSQDSMSLITDVPATLTVSSEPSLKLVMQRSDNRYLQTIDFAGWRHDVAMDIVTGSGKTGQTFLYWRGQAIFQSHASLLTAAAKWIHSPGYQDDVLDFSRRIRSACLECHVTFIETAGDARKFHADTAVWGVTCERCHGPGKQHVDYYREHPKLPNQPNEVVVSITNPATLPRDRQLDICGQCHSGMFQLKQPAFTFRPGDNLMDFHQPLAKSSSGTGGIHTSDQRQRLEESECFKSSAMTCTTCHNPHSLERGNSALFARVCQECHRPETCGKLRELHVDRSDDCIQCHMPISDNLDMADVIEKEFAVKMVDHFIRIDSAATDRFLGRENNGKAD